MKLLFLILLITLVSYAQAATHSATLTWNDTVNPAGTSYSVYRATGLCSGAPVFSKIASALTVKTYIDTTVTSGNYCYQVTATSIGMESGPSNQAPAAIPSFPPQQLMIVIQ